MLKRMQAILFSVVLSAGVILPGTTVQAADDRALAMQKQGLEPMVCEELSIEEILNKDNVGNLEEEKLSGGDWEVTAEERAYWEQFTNDYYNMYLNEHELNFWRAMEEACLEAVATTIDYSDNAALWADCDSSVSEDRMVDLMFMFAYAHPQYYFVSNRISYSTGYYQAGILNIYTAFLNGEERAAATQQFTGKVNQWLAEINAASRPEEKVKIAHDIICMNTIYDWDYNTSLYDQTAYSMVVEGKTVCAGYAKTMCMLGNAAGIETIVVTSPSHGWNCVKLHGVWYELDVTWDDTDDDRNVSYWCYCMSRATFGGYGYETSGSHVEEEPYIYMLVDAPYDLLWYDYISPYFEVDGNTYFVMNENYELGDMLVRPIEGSNAIPYKVERDGYEYLVLGGSEASNGGTVEGDAEQVKAFVERMYLTSMGREADEGGLNWWTEMLLTGKSDGAGLANGFLRGSEVANMGYSDKEFVEALYKTFFDRVPAEGEDAFWIQGLQEGVTRDSILSGFVNSEEFFNLCKSFGISRGVMLEDGTALNAGIGQFANRLYTKILEREGEEAGLENWTIQIANGTFSPEEAAKGFFASAEYQAKDADYGEYIVALYRTFMGREAEAGGMSYWLDALFAGNSKEGVLEGFAQSAEFQIIKSEYGLQ